MLDFCVEKVDLNRVTFQHDRTKHGIIWTCYTFTSGRQNTGSKLFSMQSRGEVSYDNPIGGLVHSPGAWKSGSVRLKRRFAWPIVICSD